MSKKGETNGSPLRRMWLDAPYRRDQRRKLPNKLVYLAFALLQLKVEAWRIAQLT